MEDPDGLPWPAWTPRRPREAAAAGNPNNNRLRRVRRVRPVPRRTGWDTWSKSGRMDPETGNPRMNHMNRQSAINKDESSDPAAMGDRKNKRTVGARFGGNVRRPSNARVLRFDTSSKFRLHVCRCQNKKKKRQPKVKSHLLKITLDYIF